ncbi:MAG: NAD(P)/FAD-dependent oxidoreductase [Bacteroidales bacterium]|nr:NAD(P)/FAD-dependent oxidoreductase [Bacteroidales bacterium]MCU0408354.1 NAD(P)/FAD-dependent oxidoreductase [Bacteroidales bacterium]
MEKKVVIIGGGVAGLSAGIYSRLNGFDTEIIEMHSITGGQCTAWKRKGYRFDYCLHWLVGTRKGPFNDIWKETNVLNDSVRIIDHEIHTKVFNSNGKEFIIYTNLNRWEKYLCELAPEDEAAIKKMCSDMRKSEFLSPYSDPPGLRNPFKAAASMLGMLPIMVLFMKYGKKSCKDYYGSFNFKNSDLKTFFDSMYGTRDFSALAFIMMFAWFNQKNAGYLVGGSLPMAERMTEKYLALGGKLSTRKRVKKILVENNISKGVALDDDTQVAADYVISAADGHNTLFNMLGGKYLTKKIKNAYDNWELFTPIVQVSFGINGIVPSDSPNELHMVPDCKIGRTKTTNGYSFMNYQFDPTMAPDGKSVIVMRFESPWELWNDMKPEEYENEKTKIEEDARALLLKHYPDLKDSIEVADVATPLTDVRYTGVWKGSYEGFLPSSKNLMDNIPPTLPGLKKFYMAGQWLFPGGGLPPAGQSGKWAIQYICKEEKKSFRTK